MIYNELSTGQPCMTECPEVDIAAAAASAAAVAVHRWRYRIMEGTREVMDFIGHRAAADKMQVYPDFSICSLTLFNDVAVGNYCGGIHLVVCLNVSCRSRESARFYH
jgi:hypothetical protein